MILAFLLYILENTSPLHTYTQGIYSTQILPLYMMLGILLRPKSINSPWYHYDLSAIKKVDLSKPSLNVQDYLLNKTGFEQNIFGLNDYTKQLYLIITELEKQSNIFTFVYNL